MARCFWVKLTNPLYVSYHDAEWGKPCYDDRQLFELLCLETYQAGLSWETVLNKREAFCEAFHHYDATRVAAMTDEDIEELLTKPELIRHRGKLFATRTNACAVLELGSLSSYLWAFVNGRAVQQEIDDARDLPAKTALSELISKDMKKRGFAFTGPVCIQSLLQAAGLINAHETGCDYRHLVAERGGE